MVNARVWRNVTPSAAAACVNALMSSFTYISHVKFRPSATSDTVYPSSVWKKFAYSMFVASGRMGAKRWLRTPGRVAFSGLKFCAGRRDTNWIRSLSGRVYASRCATSRACASASGKSLVVRVSWCILRTRVRSWMVCSTLVSASSRAVCSIARTFAISLVRISP